MILKGSPMSQLFSSFETKLMIKIMANAKKYKGATHPNPAVGAVIYRDQTIIAYGVHRKKGQDHAEVDAIKQAAGNTKGATMMVTLEPCTHYGSTPPCVEAIKQAEIKEVIFAANDPFEKVASNQAKIQLEKSGILVRQGLCQDQAIALNHDYHFCHQNKKPWVHLKAASSLDGKIAMASGESHYITGPQSRQEVHRLRAECKAIMIGGQTLKVDNPQLTVRFDQLSHNHVKPTLIVVSSTVDLSKRYTLFESGYPTVLVTADKNQLNKATFFDDVWHIPLTAQNDLNWQLFFEKCMDVAIYSIFIEGGEKLYSSALQAKIVNKCSFFIAPKLVGQAKAIPLVAFPEVDRLAQSMTLTDISVQSFGNDVCITGIPTYT